MQASLDALRRDYAEGRGGLHLVEVAGGYQIVTRPELSEWVRRLFHERKTQKLSVAALETLAVIAYKQPITAPEITEIRGVNTAGVRRHAARAPPDQDRRPQAGGRPPVPLRDDARVPDPLRPARPRTTCRRWRTWPTCSASSRRAGLAEAGPSETLLPLDTDAGPGQDARRPAVPEDGTGNGNDASGQWLVHRTVTLRPCERAPPEDPLRRRRRVAAGRRAPDGRGARVGQRRRSCASWAPRPTPRPTTSAWTAARSSAQTRRLYLLLNKPRGYVTTRSDPEGRPTVLDLLAGVHEYVFPVGRLDYDSEGLLLLTNDGDLAAALTHPSHEVPREYHARVRGVPDAHAMRAAGARRSCSTAGGRRRPTIRLVERAASGRHGDQALLSLTLHEGRTRQVRRMCEAVGHPVVRLRRVRIGPITDPALQLGACRPLTPRELAALRKTVRQGSKPCSDR